MIGKKKHHQGTPKAHPRVSFTACKMSRIRLGDDHDSFKRHAHAPPESMAKHKCTHRYIDARTSDNPTLFRLLVKLGTRKGRWPRPIKKLQLTLFWKFWSWGELNMSIVWSTAAANGKPEDRHMERRRASKLRSGARVVCFVSVTLVGKPSLGG